MSLMLVSLAIRYGVLSKLYGIDLPYSDATVIEESANLFLDGVRTKDGPTPAP